MNFTSYVPENVQKIFYQSYALPLIYYDSISWGPPSHLTIDRINKLQKRVAHFILFVCFVALRPKSTAMVIAGRSVHLTTLFPGQA